MTGAAGGIGAAIADALAARGANVVLCDLDLNRLADTCRELAGQYAGRLTYCPGNAADSADIAAIIDVAEEQFGPVDIWVANAGVLAGFGLDSNDDEWASSWDVNVMSHVRAARALVPGWLARSEAASAPAGCFASTASAAGLLTQLGSPAYTTTKHAVVGFAEWLAATYGDRGVQVNCLCPMGARTAMIDDSAATDPDAQLAHGAVTSAGEVLSPDTVAAVLLDAIEAGTFLALPHPEVGTMYAQKAADPDRWLTGMQRFRRSLQENLR